MLAFWSTVRRGHHRSGVSSYLVPHRGIEAKAAARWASLFYLWITSGRFLSGFVADRLGDRNMIRIGLAIIAGGCCGDPTDAYWASSPGRSCADLPGDVLRSIQASYIRRRATSEQRTPQAIIGIQMASAYTGSTFMPPVFGFLAGLVDCAVSSLSGRLPCLDADHD